MNIEIKDKNAELLEKICKETQKNPSQLIEYFLDVLHFLYSDYERQKNEGIEKRPFSAILANLFSHLFRSKLLTLDSAKRLIESTNALLGIKEHIGAAIYNIKPDFDEGSISYMIGYDFCVDASNTYAFQGLLIEVEINQDYIEVSHVVFLPILESVKITDTKLNSTSTLIQEYIKAKYCEKSSPFANIAVELFSIGENPIGPSSKTDQSLEIKLIIKADKATHIPSLEKISPIAREVHAMIQQELLTQ